jgi:hypothetical protein
VIRSIDASSAYPTGSSLPVCGSTPGFSLRFGFTEVLEFDGTGCELLPVTVGDGLVLVADGLGEVDVLVSDGLGEDDVLVSDGLGEDDVLVFDGLGDDDGDSDGLGDQLDSVCVGLGVGQP